MSKPSELNPQSKDLEGINIPPDLRKAATRLGITGAYLYEQIAVVGEKKDGTFICPVKNPDTESLHLCLLEGAPKCPRTEVKPTTSADEYALLVNWTFLLRN